MSTKLRIIFVIRSAEHFSRYASIIDSLLTRGHRVTALFDKEWSREADLLKLAQFKKNEPHFHYQWLINRADAWSGLLFVARSLLTYRRFLTVKGQSAFFKRRWKSYLPFWLRLTVSLPLAVTVLKAEPAGKFLLSLESYIPADKKIVSQIKDYRPDVLISPVGGVRVMSPNIEYLKAAKFLKIPTASPVISWDSLTTKSLITVLPDIFLLWNDFHKRQAIEHHRAREESIRIVGASVFDKWFENLKPSLNRKEFSSRHGLNPQAPYILYLGSARGTAEDETWLIRELRAQLDNSGDPELAQLNLAVRPHPANAKIYENFVLPKVAVIPKGGALPDTREALGLSHDTYYYARAVVGLFTSAMMEAQIMDKPVVIILSDKYEETQLKAQHFQDFIKSNSLELANNFKDFQVKLKKILNGQDDLKAARRAFVKKYVRPRGLDQPAGELAAYEIEKLTGSKND